MFEVGKTYKRRTEIHGIFGGQAQSGISTPSQFPYIFLFTSNTGEAFGYKDSFHSDGSFWYTGEGQVGHMELVRGNLSIVDHAENKKQLLFFEYASSGVVRFLGEVEYLGHHIEERPDRDGNNRNAIIFHLGFCTPQQNTAQEPQESYTPARSFSKKLSIQELKKLALQGASINSTVEEKRINVARRSEAVKRYALARARGKCEACSNQAPFITSDGPYLEVHHVYRLSDGGPDHPNSVIALCPNCHRRAHYAIDAGIFNSELIHWLSLHEKNAT